MTLVRLIAPAVLVGLSLVLGLAAVAKLHRPAPATEALRAAGWPVPGLLVRLVATVELAATVLGLAAPGRIAGAVLAAAYAGLALGAAGMGLARPGSGIACGCFGDADDVPLGPRHVLIDIGAAGGAAAAGLAAPTALPSAPPSSASIALVAGGCLALVVRGALRGRRRRRSLDGSALALVQASARALEARFSRRSALIRLAVAGSALSIAPLRYLLYPGTALGVVVPGGCAGGLCEDGYTAFCCEINSGVNLCPTDTFVGGWWMCTDYRGNQLCSDTGVRYYIDCNAIPGRPFPGGCRCANDSCEHRRINCNSFRYGQCNTHIRGTTPVVCRVVTCENPSLDPGLHCGSSLMLDDAVCAHEAGCLEPAPLQLTGAGGA